MSKPRLCQVAVLLATTALPAMKHQPQVPKGAAPLTSASLPRILHEPPTKDKDIMGDRTLTDACEYLNATGEAITFVMADCADNGAGSVVASLDGEPGTRMLLSPRSANSFRLAAGGRVLLAIAAPGAQKALDKHFVLFTGSRHLGNLTLKVLAGDRLGLTLVPPPGPAWAHR